MTWLRMSARKPVREVSMGEGGLRKKKTLAAEKDLSLLK